ncbi:MAG: glycosyltransferase family 9 protein [Candidatus Obscuribacterales bacterium]
MKAHTDLLACKKILVIRYRFIGDTILTVPFLRNLRYSFPDAHIDVLVGPQSGEVLQGCPFVNKFITFDTTRFHKYDKGEGKAKSFWSYAKELRKEKYDLVFVLKRSWSSAFLALLTGARHRIGYATEGRQILLTQGIAWHKDIHEVDSTLEVLSGANLPIQDRFLDAWICEEEDNAISRKAPELARCKTKVLIHAAAAHPDKMYPIDRWAEVMKLLGAQIDCDFYFSGAEQDYLLYEDLQHLAGIKGFNLAGKLSLRESMALYRRMNVSLCVDSGPAHLSAAVGVPTLALFGPTDPERWRPYGESHLALYNPDLACRPCNYNKTCNNRECLTEFSPAKIVEKAMLVMQTRLNFTPGNAQTVQNETVG